MNASSGHTMLDTATMCYKPTNHLG